MAIKLDYTACSVVAVCSCGWRALADSRAGAWTLAAAHEKQVHPDTKQAQYSLAYTRR